MTPLRLDYSTMTRKWDRWAKSACPNYDLDEVGQTLAVFFSSKAEVAYPAIKRFPNRGIMISGPKGIGKTLGFKIYGTILAFDPNSNRRLKVISVKTIELEYKDASEKQRGAEYLKELVAYPELCIDDLGREDPEYNDFGTKRNLIYDILFLRYENFVRGANITHATTNLREKDLKLLYDSAMIDRMKEMFSMKEFGQMESKRNKIDFIPETQIAPPPEPQWKKDLKFILYFISQIENDSIPFYDRDIVWPFLIKKNLISESILQDPEIVKATADEIKRIEDSRRSNHGPNWRDLFGPIDVEKESERISRHVAMVRYFKNANFSIDQITPEFIKS